MNGILQVLEEFKNGHIEHEIVEAEIKDIFSRIAKSSKFEDSEIFFKELDLIQFEIAKLVFKYDREVSPFLRKFVRDFDRLDDPETKHKIYNELWNAKEIKNNKGS